MTRQENEALLRFPAEFQRQELVLLVGERRKAGTREQLQLDDPKTRYYQVWSPNRPGVIGSGQWGRLTTREYRPGS